MGFDSSQSTEGGYSGVLSEGVEGTILAESKLQTWTKIARDGWGGIDRQHIATNKEGGNDRTKQKWFQFN